jgi:hypothetical protein
MSGVFQNIEAPPPSPPGECVSPPLLRGEDTLSGWRGRWGVNILEDARHSSVLYICKYFVVQTLLSFPSAAEKHQQKYGGPLHILPVGLIHMKVTGKRNNIYYILQISIILQVTKLIY